jgi:hypothetical protein
MKEAGIEAKVKHVLVAILLLLSGLMTRAEVWAQIPPPIIVPQVQPRFNNPGPQVTIPQPGNPLQQRTISPGSTYVPSRSTELPKHHRHHARQGQVSRSSRSKEHKDGRSEHQASDNKGRQTKTGSKEQDQTAPDQTAPDKKLRELDEALSKKLQGICRGC